MVPELVKLVVGALQAIARLAGLPTSSKSCSGLVIRNHLKVINTVLERTSDYICRIETQLALEVAVSPLTCLGQVTEPRYNTREGVHEEQFTPQLGIKLSLLSIADQVLGYIWQQMPIWMWRRVTFPSCR
ncbi:hypothetical protein HZ326_7399 [Fusarium oxysporum f. sp. albedinis]|nr:hypothetical protein HZ326_7399 [Fusarium oxysporum f. sp. albedinis]